MLTRKSSRSPAAAGNGLSEALAGYVAPKRLDRRSFLKRSGIAAGAGAIGANLPFAMVRPAEAATAAAGDGAIEVRRSVCTHCSVGCAIDAEVKNGVWVGQEPVFDSPINLGAHCAKGASVREHGHGEHRLRTPMKLVGGKWERISWETAIGEVGDKLLSIRENFGPDATYWIGSSKHSNEQSYLFRKFVSMFGTNNMDHQARICHTTTDPVAAALTQLSTLVQNDQAAADALQNSFVVQLSAKKIGLVADGVTYGPVEILADHMTRRDTYGAILVDAGRYQFSNQGQPMTGWFLTIVPQTFPSRDAANQWCTDHNLGANDCFGRTFQPLA